MNHPSDVKLIFDPDGLAIVLLDFDEEIADDLSFGPEQQSSTFTADGADWGKPQPMGGATQPLAWSRRIVHADRTAALTYCRLVGPLLPFNKKGTLREIFRDGPVFDYLNFVLLAAPTRPHPLVGNHTVSEYRAIAGRSYPVSGLPLMPGLPWSWIMTPWEDIDLAWEAL